MFKVALTLGLACVLAGCTTMKVVTPDPNTGYFTGSKSGNTKTVKKATIIKNVPVDLDSKKQLIVVVGEEFSPQMVKNLGYFDSVVNFKELEELIIKNNLTDAVPDVNSRIGLNKAAKAYKPFLWLHWNTRKDGNKSYQQLVLTDPLTLEDYFVSETYLDYVWAGVSDQNNFYPAFNALVDYIKDNSKTFKK